MDMGLIDVALVGGSSLVGGGAGGALVWFAAGRSVGRAEQRIEALEEKQRQTENRLSKGDDKLTDVAVNAAELSGLKAEVTGLRSDMRDGLKAIGEGMKSVGDALQAAIQMVKTDANQYVLQRECARQHGLVEKRAERS